MKNIVLLFFVCVLALSVSPSSAYAVIEVLSTSNFASQAPSCDTNTPCQSPTSVCSEVRYTDTNVTVNKCTGCGITGAAECTLPKVCQNSSCLVPPPPVVTPPVVTPPASGGNQNTPTSGATTPDPNAGVSGGSINNPLTNTATLEGLLQAVMQAVVQIGVIALVLALVYTGFLFASAQGNEEKIKTARHALFWVVIGGLILLGAETIALIVDATAKAL